MTAAHTIDAAGWLLVAMVALGVLGAVVYLVQTMPDEWDPDAIERAEQPLGFRVVGPVVRPPFDWSDYPEFTDAAWWGDTYSVTEGGMVHDPDDLDMDPRPVTGRIQ